MNSIKNVERCVKNESFYCVKINIEVEVEIRAEVNNNNIILIQVFYISFFEQG